MNNTRQSQCQTIYVINQDKKGVVYVIASLSLMILSVLAVKQDLDQSQEQRKYGINCDENLWLYLKVKTIGA